MRLEGKEEAAAAIVPLACFVFVTGPIIAVRWCFVTDNSQRTIVGACGLNTLQKMLQNWGRRKCMSLSVKLLQQRKRGRNSHTKHPPNPIETSPYTQEWFDGDAIISELFNDRCFVREISKCPFLLLPFFFRTLLLIYFSTAGWLLGHFSVTMEA